MGDHGCAYSMGCASYTQPACGGEWQQATQPGAEWQHIAQQGQVAIYK